MLYLSSWLYSYLEAEHTWLASHLLFQIMSQDCDLNCNPLLQNNQVASVCRFKKDPLPFSKLLVGILNGSRPKQEIWTVSFGLVFQFDNDLLAGAVVVLCSNGFCWWCGGIPVQDGLESTNTCRQASFWQHSSGPVAGCKDHFPRSVWYSGLVYTSASVGTAGVSGKDFVRQ